MSGPHVPLRQPDRRVAIPARRFPGHDAGPIALRLGRDLVEGLAIVAGLAIAALSMVDGVAPTLSAVHGFAAGCLTGLVGRSLLTFVAPADVHRAQAEEPLS
jgi:hypothetical protein